MTTVTPFPAGSNVRLKLTNNGQQVIAFGKVIYGRKDIGMGIVFTLLAQDDQKLLDEWLVFRRPATNHLVSGSTETN